MTAAGTKAQAGKAPTAWWTYAVLTAVPLLVGIVVGARLSAPEVAPASVAPVVDDDAVPGDALLDLVAAVEVVRRGDARIEDVFRHRNPDADQADRPINVSAPVEPTLDAEVRPARAQPVLVPAELRGDWLVSLPALPTPQDAAEAAHAVDALGLAPELVQQQQRGEPRWHVVLSQHDASEEAKAALGVVMAQHGDVLTRWGGVQVVAVQDVMPAPSVAPADNAVVGDQAAQPAP